MRTKVVPFIPDIPGYRSASAIYGIAKQVFPTSAADVVAIYLPDAEGKLTQVFNEARIIKAIVKPNVRVMEHPVETGATITDFFVVLPIEIELSIVISASNYLDVYQQILTAVNSGTLLTIQTRSGQYSNQIIYEVPHQEDPDLYDALALVIKTKQVQFATTIVGSLKPRRPQDTNTVDKGQQQPVDRPKSKSVLKEWGIFG